MLASAEGPSAHRSDAAPGEHDRGAAELLENAPCGFLSFGDDARISYINDTLARRLGYSREELAGAHVEKLLAIGSRVFFQTHLFPLVMLHGSAGEIFILLQSRNGEDVGVLCNAVRRERRGAYATDCAFMEVRERRKFEEALLKAREAAARDRAAAEEANHAKSNFLAVMSHELRTPLNAIGGYVQLLEMGVHGPVSEEQKETLARINRSQRHLLRLINDVLNLSRIEAGRVDYRLEAVSVADAVNAVMPMIDPQSSGKQLSLDVSVAADVVARADREKVQQVLLNLLTNAVKFTHEGGSVRADGGRFPDGDVFLRVTDTGIGIPPDMLDQVFEPFVQVDASRSRSTEGTGLGLAISRDLARGMGGDLTATSELGKGSTFELRLPGA